ncbi:MAG: glucokinase [Deltaproteobacteria bacterium]|nr:glucokinase [Deltaproteobacteria bacterium]
MSKSKKATKAKDVLVLAGDVGGTRARFALFDAAGSAVHQEVLGSREFDRFESAVHRFLDGARKVTKKATVAAATFGIAGPVVDGRVKTTNLPWVVDAKAVGKELGIGHVTLLNDLVAVGIGALEAPPAKLEVLHLGRPRSSGANVAVIAAGTGLGEAAFVWDGRRHVPCATEGAHVDFAPRSPVEAELLGELAREYGHVSYERVASGSTIHVLYNFFVRHQKVAESKSSAAFVLRAPDPNVAVVELAEKGKSEAAMRAIELWAAVYGAEASNLALKTLATGGVFVCGGASARLAKVLAKGLPGRRPKGTSPFVDAFRDKGRMRPLVERIPVAVLTEPLAGLLGAASHATKQL